MNPRLVPAKARIALKPPPGWRYSEQVTVARDSNDPSSAGANVIVSAEPIREPIDTNGYVEQMTRHLPQEFPAYAEMQLEEMDAFGENDGWLRRFEWEPEQGRRITQLQVYLVFDGYAYTATATAESKDFAQYQAELVKMLTSLRLRPEQQEPPQPEREPDDTQPTTG